MIIKFIKDQKGTTLVELIMAIFVFSLITIIVGQIVSTLLTAQRRSFAAQKVQENTLYVLELMAREIRVSLINTANTQNCSPQSAVLSITHPVNGAVSYSLSGGVIKRTSGAVITDLSGQDVEFTRLGFCIEGSGVDSRQAKATILTSVKNRTGKDTISIDIQTTVSSRDLSLEN